MKIKNRIIPTVFSNSESEFKKKFNKIKSISKNIQIDFMDGKFVSSKSVDISKIPNLNKYDIKFEAHLMVKNPEKYLDVLKRKGFSKVIFHYESIKSKEKISIIINKIKQLKLVPVIAFNPETSLSKIKEIIPLCNNLLIMGVHPGKEAQLLVPSILRKISSLKSISSNKLSIQIDGGVNEKTSFELAKAGADYLNSGSFISSSINPRLSLSKLNLAFIKGRKSR